jgi:hypothetical protein
MGFPNEKHTNNQIITMQQKIVMYECTNGKSEVF